MTMEKKSNWQEFKALVDGNKITKLYHFTDRENLESIIRNGGLYSWEDCESRNIDIARPGSGLLSRNLDRRDGLEDYVRVSFTIQHPMMFIAMNDGRISNPVILEIDPEVIYWRDTRFADMNATRTGVNVGGSVDDFRRIHFDAVKAHKHFDLAEEEQPYFQADTGDKTKCVKWKMLVLC